MTVITTRPATEQEIIQKKSRDELVASLRTRDGNMCMHPDCGKRLDFDGEGPLEVTIDHWVPQSHARENLGWTYDQIWELTNLKLMHKRCNAKKGDLVPHEDGTLPEKPTRTFRYRRQKRANRAGLCEICANGHNLAPDEICAACDGTPQAFPSWAKVKVNDCDHEILWCWACSIGVIQRTPAVDTAIRHGNSGEMSLVGLGD